MAAHDTTSGTRRVARDRARDLLAREADLVPAVARVYAHHYGGDLFAAPPRPSPADYDCVLSRFAGRLQLSLDLGEQTATLTRDRDGVTRGRPARAERRRAITAESARTWLVHADGVTVATRSDTSTTGPGGEDSARL